MLRGTNGGTKLDFVRRRQQKKEVGDKYRQCQKSWTLLVGTASRPVDRNLQKRRLRRLWLNRVSRAPPVIMLEVQPGNDAWDRRCWASRVVADCVRAEIVMVIVCCRSRRLQNGKRE